MSLSAGSRAGARRLREGRRRARQVLAAAGLVALALGCAQTVVSWEDAALAERAPQIERIAVAPLQPGAQFADQPEVSRTASQLLGRYLAEELAALGVDVVPPSDVARALGLEGSVAPLDARDVARLAGEEFGARGVLVGRVLRFRKRSGEAAGTTQSASVAFEVTLYEAPGGQRLWGATFDETQKPLFENLGNFFRYPGRGSRWLTVEELARWGAREVAGALHGALG